MAKETQKTLTFCPKCRQETFTVKIENTQKGFNHEFGQEEHWFEGHGECNECGYSGYYSDTSL